MKKLILVAILATFFSTTSAFASLKGVVRDEASRLPIAGARVSASDGKFVFTDANGIYEINAEGVLTVWSPKYWEETTQGGDVLLTAKRQRMVVLTDLGGDPDDQESMVHLLSMANEYDIEGIISNLAWDLRGMFLPNIRRIINAYGEVLPNLQIHGEGYPSDAYLNSITKYGQHLPGMRGVGLGLDTEGSDWIISIVDRPDSRPVWLTTWGGINTIAQAFLTVSCTRTAEEAAKFFAKVRIYDVLGQDDAGSWIAKNFPQVTYIRAKKVYGWQEKDQWYADNIQNVKPFGDRYVQRIWSWEGDTPAFLYLINNGLNFPEHIDYGGWGGRFSWEKTQGVDGMPHVKRAGVDEHVFDPYWMHTDTEDGLECINRWKSHIWNDFAARMQWTVADAFEKANHHPVAVVNGDKTRKLISIQAKAGTSIKLDGSESVDPDQNAMTFDWMYYAAPSTYQGDVKISTHDKACDVAIPANAKKDDTIHIVLILTDNGSPALTSYRRIVIHVI